MTIDFCAYLILKILTVKHNVKMKHMLIEKAPKKSNKNYSL